MGKEFFGNGDQKPATIVLFKDGFICWFQLVITAVASILVLRSKFYSCVR